MSVFNGKDLITVHGDGFTAYPAQCTMPIYLIISSPLVYDVPMPSVNQSSSSTLGTYELHSVSILCFCLYVSSHAVSFIIQDLVFDSGHFAYVYNSG